MNTNEQITRLNMVERRFKLRQLSAKSHKTTKQLSGKFNRLKIVPQKRKKAA